MSSPDGWEGSGRSAEVRREVKWWDLPLANVFLTDGTERELRSCKDPQLYSLNLRSVIAHEDISYKEELWCELNVVFTNRTNS